MTTLQPLTELQATYSSENLHGSLVLIEKIHVHGLIPVVVTTFVCFLPCSHEWLYIFSASIAWWHVQPFENANNLLGSMKQLSRNQITCKDKLEYEKNTDWVIFFGLNEKSCLNHDTCMLKRVMMTSDMDLYLWINHNRLKWPPP